MQGRDKSVPSIKTLMICPRMQILKETPLPKGYSYMQIDDDMDQEWIDLQMMAGNFKEQKEAYDFFWNMDRDKFVFVQDENGKLVGSAGLYPGEHFGMKRLRLGKLVVLLDHQREGIATAMITKLCVLFDSIPDRFPLYVSVNAQQHEAIKTFAKLEFTPYFGFWEGHTDKQSEHDWEIVTEILREKSISA
ncbi:MAG: GNAT family N-acetyltransferase [Firmicutes bacterium]|nr:GNAT family N-acetyltransferase [Bacillota bacterium]